MVQEKQREIEELQDEIEIILSVKDNISSEEIENFVTAFELLSESDVRNRISEITGDESYLQVSSHENKIIETCEIENLINEQHTEIQEVLEVKSEKLVDENLKDDEIHNEKLIAEKEKQNQYIKQYNFDENNIPEVNFIKGEIKYNQISVEWGWPEGVNKVIVCYRMDKFPSGPLDSSAIQLEDNREQCDETGNYVINKAIEGNYYFCVYTVFQLEEKTIFSQGMRRLIVNKAPWEIFYEIKIKRTLLGKLKSAELILSTNERELNLPQLVLVGKMGNMPIFKSEGENIFTTDYQTLTNNNPLAYPLPIENIGRNMYVKLFFLDDNNSKLYRIISPGKDKMYFK